MDCGNCSHLTVVCFHDTGPRPGKVSSVGLQTKLYVPFPDLRTLTLSSCQHCNSLLCSSGSYKKSDVCFIHASKAMKFTRAPSVQLTCTKLDHYLEPLTKQLLGSGYETYVRLKTVVHHPPPPPTPHLIPLLSGDCLGDP